jgi:hypothetical protein
MHGNKKITKNGKLKNNKKSNHKSKMIKINKIINMMVLNQIKKLKLIDYIYLFIFF